MILFKGYVPIIEDSKRNRQCKINWYRMLEGRSKGILHSNILIVYGNNMSYESACYRCLINKVDREKMTLKMKYKYYKLYWIILLSFTSPQIHYITYYGVILSSNWLIAQNVFFNILDYDHDDDLFRLRACSHGKRHAF